MKITKYLEHKKKKSRTERLNWIKENESNSVVDRHCFDADPDPNFYVDADPDLDPDWHLNNAILMRILRILFQVLHMLENLNFLFFFVSQQCHFKMYYLSHLSSFKCVISFLYFGHIEIFHVNFYICFGLIPIRIQIRQNDDDPEQWNRDYL
jgi:hypothetical protein